MGPRSSACAPFALTITPTALAAAPTHRPPSKTGTAGGASGASATARGRLHSAGWGDPVPLPKELSMRIFSIVLATSLLATACGGEPPPPEDEPEPQAVTEATELCMQGIQRKADVRAE